MDINCHRIYLLNFKLKQLAEVIIKKCEALTTTQNVLQMPQPNNSDVLNEWKSYEKELHDLRQKLLKFKEEACRVRIPFSFSLRLYKKVILNRVYSKNNFTCIFLFFKYASIHFYSRALIE